MALKSTPYQGVADEKKQAKHILLDRAISNLSLKVDYLEDLLNEISQGSKGNENTLKDGAKVIPSLSLVLNGSSEQINSLADKISDLTVKLREELF